MSILGDLLKDVLKTGPDNIKKLVNLADKLPSDSTILQLVDTVNRLIPYIPQLEKMIGGNGLSNIEGIMANIPDSKTLNKLADALPMLKNLPDSKTLNALLSQADNLKGFLNSLEGGE